MHASSSNEFPRALSYGRGLTNVMQPNQSVVPPDPLGASMALPFQHVLFPLGFPVQVRSNDQAVIRAAELSWGSFTQRFREAPIEIRFLISEIPTRRKPPNPAVRAQSNLVTIVADSHNFASCDLVGGFGFACLTKAAVMNRDYLRQYFLEAMAYMLLDTSRIVALHAACVGKDHQGVLLAGDSGAGKSSLAYACARRGWTYVSDDASSLVLRKPGRVVIGSPQAFRFRPSASHLFPELHGTTKARNGKPTMEIRTEHLPHVITADECEIDYIVFLHRSEIEVDTARLAPVSREEALRRLVQNPWPSELLILEERVAAIERLLEARCYELTYKHLHPAIDLLELMIHRGKHHET
jgi:hypothetical protein